MSLLSRWTYRPLVIFLLAIGISLFLALPAPSPIQHRVSVIGPSVVWAGSPDETLNPPPTPPKRASRSSVMRPGVTIVTTPTRVLLSTVLWRVYWATVRL